MPIICYDEYPSYFLLIGFLYEYGRSGYCHGRFRDFGIFHGHNLLLVLENSSEAATGLTSMLDPIGSGLTSMLDPTGSGLTSMLDPTGSGTECQAVARSQHNHSVQCRILPSPLTILPLSTQSV